MKVLARAVLAFETIVILLAIPVASGVDHRGSKSWVLAALALATLLAVGLVGRRGWLVAGWGLQVLVLAGTVIVPALAIIGTAFVALWGAAIVVGRRGEAVRTARLESWEREHAGADPAAADPTRPDGEQL